MDNEYKYKDGIIPGHTKPYFDLYEISKILGDWCYVPIVGGWRCYTKVSLKKGHF